MTLFARCFLLVFCQLGVGGLLSLAVPPFHELERGFFKSSAAVFWSMAAAGGGGTVYLWLTRSTSGIGTVEALLWIVDLPLFALYLSTLWGDAMVARARLYTAALAVGLAALALGAAGLVAPEHGSLAGALAALSSISSAAVLGAVTTGMLIGHWYLIDPGMELDPFRRCFGFFVRTLWLQVGVIALLIAIVLLVPATAGPGTLREHLGLVALRIVLGPAAALAMAQMIRRVLAIPQTMAATGLFYIATLAVLVGELLGRYFTFRTSLPL
jgi:hypothetical protein